MEGERAGGRKEASKQARQLNLYNLLLSYNYT